MPPNNSRQSWHQLQSSDRLRRIQSGCPSLLLTCLSHESESERPPPPPPPPTPPHQSTAPRPVACEREDTSDDDVDNLHDLNDGETTSSHIPSCHARVIHNTTLLSHDSPSRMSANPAQEVYDSLQPISPSTSPPVLSRHTSSSSFPPPNPIAAMDGALPENDGMNSLREKLQEIRQLAVSTEEKAQRMHYLMMQDYISHRTSLPSPSASPDARGRDECGGEPISHLHAPPEVDPENPYNLRPGDLDPVYSPLPPNRQDDDIDMAMQDDEDQESDEELLPDLGCMHYKRNVKVQCFDCKRWFPCRHCHDQSHDLPFPHTLNRKKTRNMLCMLCSTPQPAGDVCISCGEYAAWYFCPKCKLWDNDPNKRIYHCDDCGICRVGEGLGKDYIHCQRCNVCLTIGTFEGHKCIERATEGDCPLCLVVLFDSRTPVVAMPCGHYIHGECFRDLMSVTYKCPVCAKSAVNMELTWRRLDDEIKAQPMPEEDLEGLLPTILEGEGRPSNNEGNGRPREEATSGDAGTTVSVNGATPDTIQEDEVASSADTNVVATTAPTPAARRPREVWIGCNDCLSKCWTPFHWLGLKCQRCDSYNTNQMVPTAVHETEAERLLRQQQTAGTMGVELTGQAVLLSAGIGMGEREDADGMLAVPNRGGRTAESVSMLDVPSSPATHPIRSPPHSPGRYFGDRPSSPSSPPSGSNGSDEPRRPSFTYPHFTAPSMPNLPTLSSLSAASPSLPRLPRLPNFQRPNLPNLEAMKGFAGVGGLGERLGGITSGSMGEGWLSPYEMMSAVGRSLSPMRYYLRGEDEEDARRGGAGFGGVVGTEGKQRVGLERRASAWSEPGGWREKWADGSGEEQDEEDEEEDEGEEDSEDGDEDMLDGEEEEEEGVNVLDELEILGHR